jgi:hypothetical protein
METDIVTLCKVHHVQHCVVCPDVKCGDNLNVSALREAIEDLRGELHTINHEAERMQVLLGKEMSENERLRAREQTAKRVIQNLLGSEDAEGSIAAAIAWLEGEVKP